MIRQAALGTVLAGFEGLEPPGWLRRKLAGGLGGVVLFARNVRDDEQVARLVEAIHAEGPALVAIDEEGGDVTRLDARHGSAFPGALALGAAGDPELTRRVGAELGARLAAVGIDLNLAPVADLLLDPANPIVGVRSFGSEPATVAEHVAAWVAGLQSQGVAACLKHFPGHGATAGDSHHELPELAGGEAGLEAALAPFAAGIAAGAQAVMTAHVRIPHLDGMPATLSRPAIEGLLRGRLGFAGLVITDGLDMGAITGLLGSAAAGARALEAGVDALCLGGRPVAEADVERAVAALAADVPEDRLAEAARQVRALAEWSADSRRSRTTPPGGAAAEAARRALRTSGRVDVEPPIALVELLEEPSEAAGPVPLALRELLEPAESRRLDGAQLIDAPGSLVILARNLWRHPWMQALVAAHPEAVVVEVGVPVFEPPGVRGYVATHGASRVSCEAVAALLAGNVVRR